MKRNLYTLFFILPFLPVFVAAQNFNMEKVSRKLLEKISQFPDDYHHVHIVLADQVDLEALDQQLTEQRAMPDERAKTVISALQEKAASTQSSLLDLIASSPHTLSNSVRNFWLANAIFAKQQKELIAELSQRPDVAWIGLNGPLKMESMTLAPAPPLEPNNRETGLAAIDAPALWAMGYTGYGQLAFTSDTGVDPDVPAIATQFRGFHTTANASFFEYDIDNQSQFQNTTPFDCGYHGTHVNGTILGLERRTNDTIGVAFNAQWIGAAILCGISTEDNVAAFEWSLDPDGNPNTFDDIPDVINNSWYDPNLDTLDCYSVYIPIVLAMEAAGIAVVFSAGNEGPGVGTITQPHNINLNLVNSFTVGALNGNSTSLNIASFSSRGPSHCPDPDSSLLIKPEVSAPGVDVRSCIPGGYGFLSGTSMAAPHVSGAILLLKEAFPNLTGRDFKLALYYTARDLGFPGEDNTFGMGIINVLDAFNYLVAQGHVPVSPYVAKDVLVVDSEVPKIACDEEVSPILYFENAGMDTLTTLEIHYEIAGVNNIVEWTGSLAQTQRAKIHLPTLNVPEGTHRLRVTLVSPNGHADERPLNNIFEKTVIVIDRARLSATAEGTNTVCEGGQALLRAEYEGPGMAEVTWYDEPYTSNLLGQGMVFVTPAIVQADTFYAQAKYLIPAGLPDKNIGANGLFDEDEGLRFNALQPFKLRSVKVFAEETGLRQIKLLNDLSDVLEQKIVNVNQVGEVEVDLDWNIPVGLNFSIIKTGGKPLYGNTTAIDYPIIQPYIVSITGPTDITTDTYYYFYDWVIEMDEVCERTRVVVTANGSGDAPDAAFEISTDSVDIASPVSIEFTNTSSGDANAFVWNFGDGNISTTENPSHQYTLPGEYVVSLLVTNASGCTAFALDTVQVTQNGVSGTDPDVTTPFESILVYPNPASGELNIQFDLNAAKMASYHLVDLTGKTVKAGTFLASQNDLMKVDIGQLGTGVYFVHVRTADLNAVWKVVKL
ncbi:MAG: S8 family serine peptidase [Saprospiraceae bacterium]|nr:S8 family serine peptidase [Saprospiraceae bacterium]